MLNYPYSLMKTKLKFLPLFFIAALHAQEAADEQAVLIDPIVKETIVPTTPAPEPERLEITPDEIISSKVVYRNGQKFTIQEITPQELPPIPPPLPTRELTPEQQAARDARFAAMGKFSTLMLSCTVHDDDKTLIRWTSQGKQPVENFEAWSNINFHYFDCFFRFKKNDTTYSIMYGIGDISTAMMTRMSIRRGFTYTPPVIPELPADATAQAAFVVIKGNPTAADLEPIKGLHEIFQDNHAAMIAEYQRLKILRAAEAAERAAHPPNPKPDIIIQHWTIEPKKLPTINEGETTK